LPAPGIGSICGNAGSLPPASCLSYFILAETDVLLLTTRLILDNLIVMDFIQADTERIKAAAAEIRRTHDAMIVIGIGGSYAGAKAAIEFLDTDFDVDFLGIGFDAALINKTILKYKDKKIAVCIISKSGRTFEIMSTFGIIEQILKEKYGGNFRRHLFAVTGLDGYLREYADRYKIRCFDHPDIGGRYSVLTVTGLLPMAVAGIDIDRILQGAKSAENTAAKSANEYAKARYENYKSGKAVEVFAVGSVSAEAFGRWYQQLFSESEGKDGKGLWTSVLVYSRDLHSMGQFLQQGARIVCETIINVKEKNGVSVCGTAGMMGGSGITADIRELNAACIEAVAKAHKKAGIPVTVMDLEDRPESLGFAFCFFMSACVAYCGMLGVNPFDQPGVEDYKNEMRRILQR
jgi:glucose-6-phosphate isomerase